jgi:hypothetical protein
MGIVAHETIQRRRTEEPLRVPLMRRRLVVSSAPRLSSSYVARPPLNPSHAEVQASLAQAVEALAQGPTRSERKHGWLEETRREVSAHLTAIRDDIEGEMPPHPRDLPSQVQVVRWLDAMGVDLGDPLASRVTEAFAVARRYANGRAKDSHGRERWNGTNAEGEQ